MGLFNRKKDEQPRTCPGGSPIVARDAPTCDLCGAQLTETAVGVGAAAETTPPLPEGVERYR